MGSVLNLAGVFVLVSPIWFCQSQASAPDLLLCPQMPALNDATLLELDMWSPMATIAVLDPISTVVSTTLAPPVSGFFPTISPNEMTNQECINSTGRCYTKTALWKTSFFTWPPKNERVLVTTDDKVIVKLTNPGIFGIPYALDTSQELYNCDDKLIARIVWDFEWSQLFFPGYSSARVLDADGDDIAKIITTSLVGETKKIFELQKNVQIQSPSGVEYARMQHRFGGIGVGPLRLAQYVTIQISLSASELTAPVTEPYFLPLVVVAGAAEAAAKENLGRQK